MRIVDAGDVKREYILEMGEKFNMKLHGKKTDSLDHLSKILHTIPKYITISHMSPTSRVFQSHDSCAFPGEKLQELEEKDLGFERNFNEKQISIITENAPSTSYLLMKILNVDAKKEMEQVRYTLDLVALKLGYYIH